MPGTGPMPAVLCGKNSRAMVCCILTEGFLPAEDIAVGDGQMREASFSRKNSVRLSYAKLRFAAVLYAAVPVAVFLLGWLKPWWGVPAAALLAAGVLCRAPEEKGLRRRRKRPCACRHGCWPQCWPLRSSGAFGAGRAAIFTRTQILRTATAFCTTL